MTRLRAALALTAVAGALAATPASACEFRRCFDHVPSPAREAILDTYDTAIYVVCRIVSDGGGGC